METNRPIGIGAGLPTSPGGLEPVTRIDSDIYAQLQSIGISPQDLPKEAKDLNISDILKIINVIEETIAGIVSAYGFIKRILVGLGIIKPLSKEEKIDIIKSYALNKK